MIDVGTGLAILVQGNDFTVLFDGGSGDDKRGISSSGNFNRLVAYLYGALGPSGSRECTPAGDGRAPYTGGAEVPINHLFLSHAHDDHNSLLDDVLRCYRVENVWEPGAVNTALSHYEFVNSVANEPGVTYHTALAPHDDVPTTAGTQVRVGTRVASFRPDTQWQSFGEGLSVALGQDAYFTVLHADADPDPSDFNETSLVAKLWLGGTTLLLVGDAESGPRADPSAPVGDSEAHLLQHFAAELDADILQVGHHGSKTSSRLQFLHAVSPSYALVSAGPKPYASVVLPDREVIDALGSVGATVLRTDTNDAVACPNKIGEDDTRPGGCDNYVLEFDVSSFDPPTPTDPPTPPTPGLATDGTLAQGQAAMYTVDVPAGTNRLSITLQALEGDPDLYVRFGQMPTQTDWDCRPFEGAGTSETCNFDNPAAGQYQIMLYGYTQSRFSVRAEL